MAASEIEICNQALSRIGHTDLLEDLGVSLEDVEAGTENVALEQCRLWYPKVRDLVLRRSPWPFATRREQLALVAGETRSEWSYVYAVPADCLAVRYVPPEGVRNPRVDQRVPHRLEARRGEAGKVIGKLLLCDQENAELVFTVRVDNVVAFDPDFEAALVARLASALAPPIVKGLEGTRMSRECLEEAEAFLRVAAAAARNEEQHEPEPDGSFIASRS
jgi:hypothetical protein